MFKLTEAQIRNEIHETTIKYLEESIYPKIQFLLLQRLDEIIESGIKQEAQKFFENKNKQLGETLMKIIELLAIKKLE